MAELVFIFWLTGNRTIYREVEVPRYSHCPAHYVPLEPARACKRVLLELEGVLKRRHEYRFRLRADYLIWGCVENEQPVMFVDDRGRVSNANGNGTRDGG